MTAIMYQQVPLITTNGLRQKRSSDVTSVKSASVKKHETFCTIRSKNIGRNHSRRQEQVGSHQGSWYLDHTASKRAEPMNGPFAPYIRTCGGCFGKKGRADQTTIASDVTASQQNVTETGLRKAKSTSVKSTLVNAPSCADHTRFELLHALKYCPSSI